MCGAESGGSWVPAAPTSGHTGPLSAAPGCCELHVAWGPNYPHLWSRNLQAWGGSGQRKRSGYPAWGAAQAPECSARLLPSFLGLDGPVETDHLITGMGQVAQRVVRILRKDDLGREETGSNSAMGQAPLHRLDWGRQVPGDAPLSSSPQMPRSTQAAPTHHGHQGQRLLL